MLNMMRLRAFLDLSIANETQKLTQGYQTPSSQLETLRSSVITIAWNIC